MHLKEGLGGGYLEASESFEKPTGKTIQVKPPFWKFAWIPREF